MAISSSIHRGMAVVATTDIRVVGNSHVRPDSGSISIRMTIPKDTPGEVVDNQSDEIRVKFYSGQGLATEVDDLWIARHMFGQYVEAAPR